eukprot:TRINITY_DN3139_c0_g1_i1.p1 TRINITY_DN3139_c0_g1~~TRINITY_DN3139_c0_g1_i1.p1  ORF type:complete len:201 (-),score=29.32 TRINITY_DN3139_c0_g1_i1:69-671(-)
MKRQRSQVSKARPAKAQKTSRSSKPTATKVRKTSSSPKPSGRLTKRPKTSGPTIKLKSPAYVKRSTAGMTKRGSKAKKTDSAHKLSYRVLNTITTNNEKVGATITDKPKLVKEMNHPSNCRIKTQRGNRVVDERRDNRIAQSYISGKPLKEKTTAKRAAIALQGAATLSNPTIAKEIGEMRVTNKETGGHYKVKNYAKYN